MSKEREIGKPCPCGCGVLTTDGRYAYGHKPKGGGAGISSARKGEKLLVRNLLLVEADAELCDRVWARLSVEQKVVALNSLKA